MISPILVYLCASKKYHEKDLVIIVSNQQRYIV
jgi:hypothetical protein